MNALGFLAVGVGAACGAWLRWALGLLMSALMSPIHPGTLVANLIGGYLVGVAVAIFTQGSLVAPEWRLLIITGFCGGLTTFSAFSAEIATLLQQGRLGAMAAGIVLHVGGSLGMTLLGIASVRWLSAPH
jgi:fluoride exporter